MTLRTLWRRSQQRREEPSGGTERRTTATATYTIAIVVGSFLLAIAAAGTPVAATEPVGAQTTTQSESVFVVTLDADGSATVTLRLTYNLTSDEQRAAFESLQNDTAIRDRIESDFESRMRSITTDVADRTGRDVRTTGVAIGLETTSDESIGVVELTATWQNIAAVNDDRVVLTEPFASGFTPDRRFVVVGPDGYTPTEVTPTPTESGSNAVAWTTGTDLDGFTATFVPDGGAETGAAANQPDSSGGSENDPTVTGGQPGFGVLIGTVAVLVVAVITARRRM